MGSIVDPAEVLLLMNVSAPTEHERALVQHCIMAAEGAVFRHLQYDPTYAERTEYYPMSPTLSSGNSDVYEVSDTQAFLRRLSDSSTSELQLKHIPVRGTPRVYIDHDGRSGTKPGSFAASTEITCGLDFWPNSNESDDDGEKVSLDGILRSEGRWPNTPGSVKVVYTAGYKTAEFRGLKTKLNASPILECVIDETTRRFHKAVSRAKSRLGFLGPLTSENLGEYSYSRDSALYAKLVSGPDLDATTVQRLETYANLGWALS